MTKKAKSLVKNVYIYMFKKVYVNVCVCVVTMETPQTTLKLPQNTFKPSQYNICTGKAPILDTGYPHDGRADNAAYWHDRRADKRCYPHDIQRLKCSELDTF